MKKIFILVFVFFLSVPLYSAMRKPSVQDDTQKIKELKNMDVDEEFIFVTNSGTKLSPNDDTEEATIDFYIALSNENIKVKNWNFSIINEQTEESVLNVSGAKEMPSVITWNGRKDNVNEVVEGTYKYIFNAVIGNKKNEKNIKVEQNGIIVDITPPYLSLSFAKDTFFADKDKNKFEKEMSIALNAGDENKIDMTKTDLQIINHNGKIVKQWQFSDAENIPDIVYWDGIDDIYGTVIPAGEYKAVFNAYDNFGNTSNTSATFTVFEKIKGDSKIVVKEEPRGLLVNLSSNILFATNKSVLKPEAAVSLDETVNLLNTYPANKVLIEGYTDSTGIEEKNLKLSYDRAQAVYTYLIQKGIKADRLTAVGFGSKNPVATNKTAVGRAQNRRVNIIILKNSSSNADNTESSQTAEEPSFEEFETVIVEELEEREI